MYAESKMPRFFCFILPRIYRINRKFPYEILTFFAEICEFRDQRILKIGRFHRVKELCKSLFG